MEAATYFKTISELEEESRIPRRRIHFYIAEGILDPPRTKDGAPAKGGGARYSEKHLTRLKLIRKYQDPVVKDFGWGVRLSRIKDVLDQLEDLDKRSPGLIRRVLDNELSPDVIRRVMSGDMKALENEASSPDSASHAKPSPPGALLPAGEGLSWTRLELADGLELHVRSDVAEKVGPTISALQQLAAKKL